MHATIEARLKRTIIKSGMTLKFLIIVIMNLPPRRSEMAITPYTAAVLFRAMPYEQRRRSIPASDPEMSEMKLCALTYPIIPPIMLKSPNRPMRIVLKFMGNSPPYSGVKCDAFNINASYHHCQLFG